MSVLEAPTVPEDNVVSRNVVTGNLGDGILVDSGAIGTLLVRYPASRNGDDGIDVDVPATTVTRNIANRNRDLGIEAVPRRHRRWREPRHRQRQSRPMHEHRL